MRRKLWAEEMALAMELHADRVPVKVIAKGLGVHPFTLAAALRIARACGFAAFPLRSGRD